MTNTTSPTTNTEVNDTVLFQQNGSIGTMIFNRPDVFNAMSSDLITSFCEGTRTLLKSTTLRALIIKGAGKAFLAGGDVNQFHRERDTVADTVKPLGDALHEGIINIRNMPFPVIAQVHGACAGAGLSVMMACDFAVAATGTQFKTAYSQIGLSPDGGSTYFLPRLVGMKKATELIMLSEVFTAERALEMGLVNRVVAPGALTAEVEGLANQLAQGATQAFARAKRLLNQSWNTPIQAHLDDEIGYFADCARTEDFKEGVTAFVEKRKPVFSGK
jgi:2-(1,2-epoxy-1,2-dihydrophenyl)acetyl-CoA isomerase